MREQLTTEIRFDAIPSAIQRKIRQTMAGKWGLKPALDIASVSGDSSPTLRWCDLSVSERTLLELIEMVGYGSVNLVVTTGGKIVEDVPPWIRQSINLKWYDPPKPSMPNPTALLKESVCIFFAYLKGLRGTAEISISIQDRVPVKLTVEPIYEGHCLLSNN